MNKLYITIAIAYILSGVLAFGHSMNHYSQEIYVLSTNKSYQMPEDVKVFGSLTNAAFSPLYWSMVAFDKDSK
jgi:predicted transglutaminase-like protease